jgi:hypothetical protein
VEDQELAVVPAGLGAGSVGSVVVPAESAAVVALVEVVRHQPTAQPASRSANYRIESCRMSVRELLERQAASGDWAASVVLEAAAWAVSARLD